MTVVVMVARRRDRTEGDRAVTQTSNPLAALAAFAPQIDHEIEAELTDLDPFMRGAIRYHFGWVDRDFAPIAAPRGGKKLRPTMLLLAHLAGSVEGKSGEAALPVAACIEMIHNYSLIHDDIEDGDHERHGRATLWTIWGKPMAINVGDCLHVLAFRKLYRSIQNVSAARVVQIANLVADTSVRLALGQHMDMGFETDLSVTPDLYERMIGGKTASLIRCAVVCGLLVALDDSLDPDLAVTAREIGAATSDSHAAQQAQVALDSIAAFGLNIGLGFQIRDDILGIWGAAEQTGKSTSNDIRRRKKSLPIITALDRADPDTRQKLRTLYAGTHDMSDDDVAFVLRALEESGAHRFAQSEADRFKVAALDALTSTETALNALHGTTGENRVLRQLRDLSTFLVEREY